MEYVQFVLVPGLRSSNAHVLDTKPDPRKPVVIRTITAKKLVDRVGHSRSHTVHCGPDGIDVSALADADGKAPGGVFMMDHESFDVSRRWEIDRGPQQFSYEMWWHLGHDPLVTSERATPDMFEDGLEAEMLRGSGSVTAAGGR